MPLLEIDNLHTYYGNIHALKGISLNVEKGEIVGLLGRNAAGKTTTMRILTGYLSPTSGEVTIAGENMLTHSLEARRHILDGEGETG